MRRLPRVCWLVLFGLVLVGAAPALTPDDLVREGNAAFAAGEYETAVDRYTKAETHSTDPGLVAFNKATALYRLKRYAEAEKHFRACLSDAAGPRRARVLYGLGNSLLHLTDDRDVAALQEVVRCYELCLEQDDVDDALAADARHNLELAKLLWLKAKAKREHDDPTKSDSRNDQPKPPDRQERPGVGTHEPGPGKPRPRPDRVPAKLEPGQEPLPIDEPQQPGAGNLPPVPDTDELAPLPPEDVAAHLQRAAAQILRERREHQQRSVKPSAGNVKNW
jgi:tetratricopeptide (TPR) repeat protein